MKSKLLAPSQSNDRISASSLWKTLDTKSVLVQNGGKMQRKRVFCVTVFTNNVLKKRKDMNTEFPPWIFSPCDSGVSIWETWFFSLLLCFSSSQMACRPGFRPIWSGHRAESQHSVSADNTVMLYYCLYEQFYNKDFFGFYVEQNWRVKATPDLNPKIQPMHTVVLFSTMLFFYIIIEQMEKYESEHKHCMPWSGLSFPFFTLRQMLVVVYTAASSLL